MICAPTSLVDFSSRPSRSQAPITSLDFSFATHDDIPRIVDLVDSAYRGDASRSGWTTEADLLGGQRTDAGMVRDALERPGAHVLLAHRAGRLVACCELQRPSLGRAVEPAGGRAGTTDQADAHAVHQASEGTPPQRRCSPDGTGEGTAYFGMFAVDPTLQGGGVGRAVLEEAERIVRDEWAAGTMELTVIDLRSELIAWYERRGYTRTGHHKPFPYGEERFGIPARDDLRLAVLRKPLR